MHTQDTPTEYGIREQGSDHEVVRLDTGETIFPELGEVASKRDCFMHVRFLRTGLLPSEDRRAA